VCCRIDQLLCSKFCKIYESRKTHYATSSSRQSCVRPSLGVTWILEFLELILSIIMLLSSASEGMKHDLLFAKIPGKLAYNIAIVDPIPPSATSRYHYTSDLVIQLRPLSLCLSSFRSSSSISGTRPCGDSGTNSSIPGLEFFLVFSL
jgi:hypothetical protein